MPPSRLGTSLENLLGRNKPVGRAAPADVAPQEDEILHIPVEDVQPNPSQPRTDFNEESFQHLVLSVRQNGIIQPVVVRRVASGFELIAGERRWRAARAAKLRTVPAQVRNVDSAKAFELSIVENIQRDDLNPMERARAYKRFVETFELTQEVAAQRLGVSRSAMANIMRLLELPGEIQDAVSRGTISMGHARALLGLRKAADQLALWRKVERKGLSVRQVEKQIAAGGVRTRRRRRGPAEAKEAHIVDLEEKLRAAVGTKVSIQAGKRNTGSVVIEYYSLDDFDRIVERILGERGVADL